MNATDASSSWVLDTNVVVSGVLSPHGPPGRLIDMVLHRRLHLELDDRILAEYRQVLSRPKFSISSERLRAIFNLMRYQRFVASNPVHGLSAVENEDTMFLEVAAGGSKIFVTGNLRHFPESGRGAVEVITPAEAWDRFQEDSR